MNNRPAILPDSDRFRARSAFIRFQHALDSLEHEMEPLAPEMSVECRFELQMLGRVARSFFRMANEEIFAKARVEAGAERQS